jgi:hypothetical protein
VKEFLLNDVHSAVTSMVYGSDIMLLGLTTPSVDVADVSCVLLPAFMSHVSCCLLQMPHWLYSTAQDC